MSETAEELDNGIFDVDGVTHINRYLQWVDEQCASWKEKQFIKKEQEDACQ